MRRIRLGESAVVAGCVLVASSVVITMLASIRERSSGDRCLANLRAIGLATHEYAASNSGFLPYTRENWLGSASDWARTVDVKDSVCPSAARTKLSYVGAGSCWMNPRFLDGIPRPGEPIVSSPTLLGAIRFPESKVLGAEWLPWHQPSHSVFMQGDIDSVVFVDGHGARMDYFEFNSGFYPGRSINWTGALSYHGTKNAYLGRDVP